MTRFPKLHTVVVCLVSCLLGVTLAASSVMAQAGRDGGGGQQREIGQLSISLRELTAGLPSSDAAKLCGATWLRGFAFIEDERGKDCILLTYVEPGRPALRLDDFVVAYLNVKESRQRPACTINPREKTLRRLSELGRRLMTAAGPSGTERHLNEWKRIARSPQDVIVYGVSPDTHFAKVMVEADYFLKNVTNGTEKLEGVTSLTQMFIEKIKKEVEKTGKLSTQMSMYNRFWFNPKPKEPARFQTDLSEETVILGKCPVVLLTEEEALTPQGKLAGKSRPNPVAKKFADEFTVEYKKVAELKSIYRELETLYRLVAIADLLLQQGKKLDSLQVVEDLVRQVKIQKYRHDATLPGRASVDRAEGTTNEGQYYLCLPSCGGVSINLHVDPTKHRVPDPQGFVGKIRETVLKSRPSPKSVCWKFRSELLFQLAERSNDPNQVLAQRPSTER